jgi:xanthine dehydrogenase small subunit
MAGTPARATHVENVLLGKDWTWASIEVGMAAFAKDYTPMSDMRASQEYRLEAAQNMLLRYFLTDQGIETDVLAVTP